MDEREIGPDRVLEIRTQLEKAGSSRRERYGRFTLSALSSIPWVGGFLSATADLDAEKAQGRVNALHQQWLELHHEKLEELGRTLAEIVGRLETLGELASERLEDESYLGLVAQGFRVWDESATEEKKKLVQRLLENAGGTTLCSDDVVRLFIDWIQQYHEIHFAVIRTIHRSPGVSRSEIWQDISGVEVRDDSAEADLFKLLIRDLSTGSVIRQARESDIYGRFYRKRSREPQGEYLASPFDNTKPYVLTELGRQFVHYAMDEAIPRIVGENGDGYA